MADQHNLLVIEDCAQSFGAGSWATDKLAQLVTQVVSAFSRAKNLGCYGDGGLFTTNSDELAEQFSLYSKNHGSKITQSTSNHVGWNSRLDELQAAILRIKLRYIDHFQPTKDRCC